MINWSAAECVLKINKQKYNAKHLRIRIKQKIRELVSQTSVDF